MKIQINTDNHITDRDTLAEQAKAAITGALGHLAEYVTRVEVHLSDENGEKAGRGDKRCVMEARHEGREPIATTHEAETIAEAIDGAADKLKSSLDQTLARLNGCQPEARPRPTRDRKKVLDYDMSICSALPCRMVGP